MARFNFKENKFGKYDTLLMYDEDSDYAVEAALLGATVLNFTIPLDDVPLNIIDGFANPNEFEAARGARCWIMAPFANRIPDGIYNFNNKTYQLKPIPPRDNVIHGFAAYQKFTLNDLTKADDFIEAELFCNTIRPGKFEGYPFALDIKVKLKLELGKLTIKIIGENVGDEPLPFHCGWHPYFRTGFNGIDHLLLQLDADEIILLDNNFIPLPGKKAYENVSSFKEKKFSSNLPPSDRRIDKKILNDCFSKLSFDEDGYAKASIYDPSNKLKIELIQKGGVTLLFSGEGLAQRERKSVAIEPMQFITNAFNRPELSEMIKVMPGEKSIFKFGVKAGKSE